MTCTRFQCAESIAPILNPTLFRQYSHSEKAQFIKRLIEAAIPLKRLVEEGREIAARDGCMHTDGGRA